MLALSACGGGGSGEAESIPEPVTFTVELSTSPEEGGSVSGGGVYELYDEVVINATAAPGYTFLEWTQYGAPSWYPQQKTFRAIRFDRSIVAQFTRLTDLNAIRLPPQGKTVTYAASSDGRTIYAATQEISRDDGTSGIWVSNDEGAKWEKVSDEYAGVRTSPNSPSLALANIDGERYIISKDYGRTWTKDVIVVLDDYGNLKLDALGRPVRPALRGASSNSISDGIFIASPRRSSLTQGGVYRSLDGGASWVLAELRNQSGELTGASDVAVSTYDPDIVYASSNQTHRVWKSVDNGSTYFLASNGLPDGIDQRNGRVLIDPNSSDRIIYKDFYSLNGGSNWTRQDSLAEHPLVWFGDVLLRLKSNLRGVRIDATRDFGESWATISKLDDLESAARVFSTPDNLFIQDIVATASRRSKLFSIEGSLIEDNL